MRYNKKLLKNLEWREFAENDFKMQIIGLHFCNISHSHFYKILENNRKNNFSIFLIFFKKNWFRGFFQRSKNIFEIFYHILFFYA